MVLNSIDFPNSRASDAFSHLSFPISFHRDFLVSVLEVLTLLVKFTARRLISWLLAIVNGIASLISSSGNFLPVHTNVICFCMPPFYLTLLPNSFISSNNCGRVFKSFQFERSFLFHRIVTTRLFFQFGNLYFLLNFSGLDF